MSERVQQSGQCGAQRLHRNCSLIQYVFSYKKFGVIADIKINPVIKIVHRVIIMKKTYSENSVK